MTLTEKIRDINAKYEADIKSLVPEIEEFIRGLVDEYYALERVKGVYVQVGYDDSGRNELDVGVIKELMEPDQYDFYSGHDYELSQSLENKIPQEIEEILLGLSDGFCVHIGDMDY